MTDLTHPLDRPIWHALSERQFAYAIGAARARRFVADAGMFAATRDDTPHALADLGELVRTHGPVVLLQAGAIPVPPGTTAQMTMLGVQMVARRIEPLDPAPPVERLTAADVPAMLALTAATQPGPFFARTHELGTFWGVKIDGRLVAMAGERLKLPGYTEVSAVCTDPAHRGKGYAGTLSRIVATQILNRGETPILHAYASNTPAVRLYEQLGFELRTHVNVTVLAPP
ncbi:MAG: GNAT family N-acetyltransferase [Alphaproteobacteria bacterium]|nr:GNAT family N-acetyltransferase [Alphaproteobacteria bacterium]